MKTVRVKLDPTTPASFPKGRVNKRRLDETTEQDIAQHQRIDDDEATQDAALLQQAHPRGSGFSRDAGGSPQR